MADEGTEDEARTHNGKGGRTRCLRNVCLCRSERKTEYGAESKRNLALSVVTSVRRSLFVVLVIMCLV